MSNILEKCNHINEEKSAKLLPENLREGITFLGVTGTLKEGIDTSDATATSSDIAIGKTAYVNGEKIEGTVEDVYAETRIDTPELIDDGENLIMGMTTKADMLYRGGVDIKMMANHYDVAETIGLTPDRLINTDEPVLGMHGDIQDFRYGDLNVQTAYIEDYGDELNLITKPVIDSGYPGVAIAQETRINHIMPYDELTSLFDITPEKIVAGNTILGVEGIVSADGIDTSDATATSSDIVVGKTAYANGEKLEGSVTELVRGGTRTYDIDTGTLTNRSNNLLYSMNAPYTAVLRWDAPMSSVIPHSDIATAIGLTADQIVSGNTILGVEGTAEVSSTDCSNHILILSNVGELEQYKPVNNEPRRALIYNRPDIIESNTGDAIKIIHFPYVITLDSPMETSASMTFHGEDISRDVYVDIEVHGYPESNEVHIWLNGLGEYYYNNKGVKYITEDGLTYRLQEVTIADVEYYNDNTIYLPVEVTCSQTAGNDTLYKFLLSVVGGSFDGMYEYYEDEAVWTREPMTTTAFDWDVREGKEFISVHGSMIGAMTKKDAMTYIQISDTEIQNLATLMYEFQDIPLDDDSMDIYGRVINFRLDGDNLIVNIDIKNESSLVGSPEGLLMTVEFFDSNGNGIGGFWEISVENYTEVLTQGKRSTVTLIQDVTPDATTLIYKATAYKMSFTSV